MNLNPMRMSTLRHWKYIFSDKDSNEVKSYSVISEFLDEYYSFMCLLDYLTPK